MNEAEAEVMHQSQMEDAVFQVEAAIALGRQKERADIVCKILSSCQRMALRTAFIALQEKEKEYGCDDCAMATSRLMAYFTTVIKGDM